ncbi:MAG TPA: hypothetical protein VJ901_05910 [Thermoanaerobaculia bacterium]|nr:hypothetical protein [Thermoanaerobaculia bacterium]
MRAAFAIYGASIAIALAPSLQRHAQPGALPSGIAKLGFDASGPSRQFILLLVLTFAFALLSTFVMRFVVEQRWAMWTSTIALASAPLTLMYYGNVRHVLLHGLAAAAIVFLRRFDPHFSRADVVLIPVALSFHLAFLDLDFGHTPISTLLRAIIVTLALRMCVPSRALAAAPLAFALQWNAWLALAFLIATPFALMRIDPARLHRFAAWIAYPIGVAAYSLALLNPASPQRVDFFEDGHDLQPAHEMLHGKRPYTDIVPIHGLMSDGGVGWMVMKLGGNSIGAVLKTRMVIASLSATAIYFVAFAATGSAEAALLAVFLAYSLLPAATVWMRAAFAIAALACTVASVRNPKWMIGAGALLVIAGLFSLDLAIDSAIVALIASIRWRSWKQLAIGVAGAAVPVLIVFAIGGFAIDFFRVTVTEVLGARGAYVVAPLTVPNCLRAIDIGALGNRDCTSFVVWVIALVFCAASRRLNGTWLIGLWIVVAGTSYVERQHHYFDFAVAAFVVSLLWHHRQLALIVLLIVIARPLDHVLNLATPLRRAHGVPIGDAKLFGDVYFDPRTVAALNSTQRFLATIPPNDTFFDFANAGLLYAIFDRETPIRHMSVPMYESKSAQREVIAALERKKPGAALIVFPAALSNIDDVPNQERAPLVWQYLQAHYAPAFDENGVVFWKRAR